MKIKKVREMKFEKQRKILMARKKLLKAMKAFRNTAIFGSILVSPMYTNMLQEFLNGNNVSAPENIIKYSIVLAGLLGLVGITESLSNKYIADCATLKAVIEMNKIEKREHKYSGDFYQEDYDKECYESVGRER